MTILDYHEYYYTDHVLRADRICGGAWIWSDVDIANFEPARGIFCMLYVQCFGNLGNFFYFQTGSLALMSDYHWYYEPTNAGPNILFGATSYEYSFYGGVFCSDCIQASYVGDATGSPN